MYLEQMRILALIFSTLPLMSFSQELHTHLWKNRILLIIADSYQTPTLIQQMQEFENKTEELHNRKLILYQLTPTSYQTDLKKGEIIEKNTLYKKYNPSKDDFKLILIGLDGGIKLEKNNVVKPSLIFSKIDQMPMRLQELRSKNN